MTVQPADDSRPAPWSPDPVRQKRADYTIEDVLSFPDEAPRMELIDGRILVVPSPGYPHQRISTMLLVWLFTRTPKEFEVIHELGVLVAPNHTLEPDLLLIDPEGPGDSHYLLPEHVTLAVEIVSPGTKRRDRLEKPAEYAAVGIPFYWRIEQDPVHVYAYQLVDGAYQLAHDSDTELVLDAPFAITLPISEITP